MLGSESETFVPSSSADDVPATPAARHEFEAPERAACHREAPEARTGRTAEAPDAGDQDPRTLEAPESRDRQGRDAEAPDAGDGRASYVEGEFTHGRSQS